MNFFQGRDVAIVKLAQWLDWAGGKITEKFVALPMIQRGSVWQPHQIIDLWDSLLQGMPIGSMMVTELAAGTSVRRPGNNTREMVPDGGGLGLIDGQQRTLAMLVAWQTAVDMDQQRVWVDFSDEPAPGQLLRLRVTTKNQYFGFQRAEPSRKLSLDDRRKARDAFKVLSGEQEPNLKNAQPFSHDPGLPVNLSLLIDLWREKNDSQDWFGAVNEHLRSLKGAKFSGKSDSGKWIEVIVWETLSEQKKAEVLDRVEMLASALERLMRLEMPLIRVGKRFFQTKDESSDPPLAVLFKRIGKGAHLCRTRTMCTPSSNTCDPNLRPGRDTAP